MMKVNIEDFIARTGLKEPLYPGKKFVQVCAVGPFKSHSIVYDWHDPTFLRIEIKAGTSGQVLPIKELRQYPISFQTATHVVIEMSEDDGDDGEGRRGTSGSGSRAPKTKSLAGFMKVAEGKIPAAGKIVEMVVMGKDIAQEAFGVVFDALTAQIEKLKMSPTDLLAKAGKFITKYTPPAFLEAKGDEDAKYVYDREKIDPMFGISPG
ncbi:MAG: hypothetical protein H6855_01085 [Rhodospirillales bacterium]|nr:hypothetical protein [Rhodospirillales bacterium]MCB9964663.1 hypothetical protein [Rhodospirillales bacterium]MCB9979953.1 hypothetical protein [Rhodospirillales bacterium]